MEAASGLQRAPAFAPGERCGAYRIDRLVAAGGIGDVYAGVHAVLGRKAAIKVLQQRYADRDDLAKRLELEARVLSQIRHPNMVSVYDAGIIAGDNLRPDRVWMAMEFLEGTTLRHLVGHGDPLPVPQAIRYCRDIALGVQAAHDAGAVHRDLKPENVMVCDDGRVVVLDLGTAKHLRGTQMRPTQRIIGTVAYMSPEHLLGEDLDGRADVYSLGLVLWEMCVGYHPFSKSNSTFDLPTSVELARMQIESMPPPLARVASWVPKDVARLIERSLRKEPAERYADMAVFAAELTKLEHALGAAGPGLPTSGHAPIGARPSSAPLHVATARSAGAAQIATAPLRQLHTVPLAPGEAAHDPTATVVDAAEALPNYVPTVTAAGFPQSGHTLRLDVRRSSVPTEAMSTEEQARHTNRAAFPSTVRDMPVRHGSDMPTRTAEPFGAKRGAKRRRIAVLGGVLLLGAAIGGGAYLRSRAGAGATAEEITPGALSEVPATGETTPGALGPMAGSQGELASDAVREASPAAATPTPAAPSSPSGIPVAGDVSSGHAGSATPAAPQVGGTPVPSGRAGSTASSARAASTASSTQTAAPASSARKAAPPTKTQKRAGAQPTKKKEEPAKPREPFLLPGMPSSGL